MNGADPIFSFKSNAQTEQLSGEMFDDIANALETVSTMIDTVKDVVSTIFKFAFGVFKDYRDVDISNLRPRDIKVVPTPVENSFGESMAAKVCSEEETETGTVLDDWVQGVGKKLLQGSKRDGLAYQFLLKKDDEPNAFVVPGGKMILTTGLIEKLKANGGDEALASVLSYLIARSEGSEETKTAQTGVLMHLLGKISSAISGYFYPEDAKEKQAAKKNRAVNELVDQGVELGTQVFLHRQKAEAEETSRTRAAELLKESGFEGDRSSMDKVLDSLFDREEDEEAYQDDVHEQLGAMMPNIFKIFA